MSFPVTLIIVRLLATAACEELDSSQLVISHHLVKCPNLNDPSIKAAATVKLKAKREAKHGVKRDTEDLSDSDTASIPSSRATASSKPTTPHQKGSGSSPAGVPLTSLGFQRRNLKKAEVGHFEQLILNATISANLPFHWVNDLAVQNLFGFFLDNPEDALPSPYRLSHSLLAAAVSDVDREIREKAATVGEVGLFEDGWSNVKREKLANFGVSIAHKVRFGTFSITLHTDTASLRHISSRRFWTPSTCLVWPKMAIRCLSS